VVDSGGAGRWRGGLSAETCFVPHRTEVITQDTLSSGNAIPTSTGMMGGYPATVNVYKFVRDTDIRERLAKREMVTDISQVDGRPEELQLRQENFQQHPRDVYSVIWSAAGGFGDPLERDPARVCKDVVENRAVSRESARAIYGVVVSADEKLDPEATTRLRAERRDVHRRKDGLVRRLTGKVVAHITDNLDVRKDNGSLHTACSKCAADLGPVRENYKDHAVRADNEIASANPHVGDWKRYIDERPVFRQFYCPGCGALLENEIAREGDPVLRDIELRMK
jgi:N-methylhydantoinase B